MSNTIADWWPYLPCNQANHCHRVFQAKENDDCPIHCQRLLSQGSRRHHGRCILLRKMHRRILEGACTDWIIETFALWSYIMVYFKVYLTTILNHIMYQLQLGRLGISWTATAIEVHFLPEACWDGNVYIDKYVDIVKLIRIEPEYMSLEIVPQRVVVISREPGSIHKESIIFAGYSLVQWSSPKAVTILYVVFSDCYNKVHIWTELSTILPDLSNGHCISHLNLNIC